jgi:DNA-binding response OmpR family regulator
METKKKIWVVEDDKGLQFVYGEILGMRYSLEFYETLAAFREGLNSRSADPDLLILDLRLPDGSFLDLLTHSESGKLLVIPFLIVSSVDDLDALRICFEEGAIDYITKPFGKSELIVKIERIFQREKSPQAIIDAKDRLEILLDPVTLTVKRGLLHSPPLTSKEYQILSVLYTAPENLLPREQIVDRVWQKTKVTGKTLDVHLFNLRKKLANIGVELVFRPPHSFKLLTDGMG